MPRQLIDRRQPCPNAHALVLGATLAAMHLAGLTAVANAQASDPDGKDARRLATERQVAGTERERPVTAQQQAAADATLQRVLARERFSIPSQTPDQPTAPAPPNPADSPAGSSLPSVVLLLAWRWPAGWRCSRPDGPAAEPESGTRPDHSHGHAARWGCRAHPAAPSPAGSHGRGGHRRTIFSSAIRRSSWHVAMRPPTSHSNAPCNSRPHWPLH
jgi:hypothetical protein